MMLRALAVLLVLGACDCGRKSDEEILAERIDSTPVHVYLAAKIALTKGGDDPEIVEARRVFSAAMTSPHVLGALVRGEGDAPALSPSDALALTRALVGMKGLGQRALREGKDDELEPLLPALLGLAGHGDALPGVDRNTDHALFFLGLWVAKVHPKVPTPIPQEVLLYEASRTDAAALAWPALAPPVLSLRAYTYATNELCDLARRDATALGALQGRAVALQGLFTPVGGSALDAESAVVVDEGLLSIAHASTAVCYYGRGEREQGDEALGHFVDAAARMGTPPEDLALVRAYLAYRRGDLADARAMLTLAKSSSRWDERERRRIDELLTHLDRDDTGALDRFFDKVFFASFAVKVAFDALEKTGAPAAIAETPFFRTMSGFTGAIGDAIGGARARVDEAARDVDEAARGVGEKARGLWEKVRGE
ncbi:MAG: hypothetical protein KF901_28300 [Myxococcales bacterium]|nr:hypothetical protein [Myxococcales bacterium]